MGIGLSFFQLPDELSSDDCDWHAKGIFSFLELTDDNIKASDSNKDAKLTGSCKLCKPEQTTISGRKSVTSNFRKHMTVCDTHFSEIFSL